MASPPRAFGSTNRAMQPDQVRRVVRKMIGTLEEYARQLELIELWIKESHEAGSDEAAAPAGRRGRSDVERRLLAAEVADGAMSLDIVPAFDGCTVSISGRRPFHLSPQLGTLLQVLADCDRGAGDGLLGWQSRTEIAEALSKRTGKDVRPVTVARIMFKLRKALRDAGENEGLLQTSRRHGFRVAIRRVPQKDPS